VHTPSSGEYTLCSTASDCGAEGGGVGGGGGGGGAGVCGPREPAPRHLLAAPGRGPHSGQQEG
jgi:hypothetical protein